jgi:probable rRNA maturation factor
VALISRVSFLGKTLAEIENVQESLEKWLHSVAFKRGFRIKRLVYHLEDNESIRGLNSRILGHDYATDIITLDYSEGKVLEVEMFLGYEVIKENASSYNTSFADELDRVVAHGLLHCIGFNDKSAEQSIRMSKEEDICLISRPKSLLER